MPAWSAAASLSARFCALSPPAFRALRLEVQEHKTCMVRVPHCNTARVRTEDTAAFRAVRTKRCGQHAGMHSGSTHLGGQTACRPRNPPPAAERRTGCCLQARTLGLISLQQVSRSCAGWAQDRPRVGHVNRFDAADSGQKLRQGSVPASGRLRCAQGSARRTPMMRPPLPDSASVSVADSVSHPW